jgi:hypothetical protein
MTYPHEDDLKVEEVHEKISLRAKVYVAMETHRECHHLGTSAESCHIIGSLRRQLSFEKIGVFGKVDLLLVCSCEGEGGRS